MFMLFAQAYMEDHLQNKERLAEEWSQLQSYEADPCSTAHAQKTSNSRKNRYGDALPCEWLESCVT